MTMTTSALLTRARVDSLRAPGGIRITDEIRSQFPAVFSEAPSPAMSSNYQFYPSYRLIEDMDKLDMKLVQIGQQNSIKRAPEHQMHVLRFQPNGSSNMPTLKVGDSQLELVILNSHNGRNRFQAFAGIFRLVCLNGMVVADQDLGSVRTKHFGAKNNFDVIKELIDGMASRTDLLSRKMVEWQGITLSEAQQIELARRAMEVRKFPSWMEPGQLLDARRATEDMDPDGNRDLWTTFNVIQENVMKGEIDRTGEGRPSHTRPVTGAFADVDVNRRLWEQLEDFTEALDGPATPVDEPEVQAVRDAAGEESKEDRKRRLDRERKAAKRAAAKQA
jgi:hypothetical protein